MIESLSGLHETVNFKKNTQIKLYNNDEFESYPPHWHTTYELIMPVEGTYRVTCSEFSYELQTGDILIIAPGIIHELFAPPEGIRIIFQAKAHRMDFQEVDLINSIINPAILITPDTHPQIHQKIRERMLQIREEYFDATPFSELSIYSHFFEMLVLVGRDYSTHNQSETYTFSKQKEYFEKINNICTYINNHFAENLTLEDAARQAGFSKYHFTRLFRQFTNTTFYKYISQKRISHATELLMDENYSIMEVAYLTGFSSNTAFTRMFKTVTGHTPLEFRKMYNAYKPRQ